MALNAKNFGLAGGIFWGACLFIWTLVSAATGYSAEILNLLATVYVGYSVTWLGSIIGLIYGFIDGFIALFIFAFLYNWLEKR